MTPPLKLVRKFDVVKPVDGTNAKPFLVRREVPKPAVPLVSVGDCLVCGNALMVAPGQRIRFHKACRKEGRRRFGRSEQTLEVEPIKTDRINP